MSQYCIDTSAYSRFRRGDSQATQLLDSADQVWVPSIVVGELMVGFKMGHRTEANNLALGEFLANANVNHVAVDHQVSYHYADIVIELRQRGTPIPTNDIWIAAAAARVGSIVLSYDDHFSAVSRVGSLVLSDD